MEDLFEEKGTDQGAMAIEYGQQLLIGILVLIIGSWIAGLMTKSVKKLMQKHGYDPALQSFLGSILGITLKILVVISALSTLGIERTSFIAILGVAGLAVGMALSGTLQNFAGGVMILIFKPIKVGNVIQAQGYTESVSEIQILKHQTTKPSLFQMEGHLLIIALSELADSSVNFMVRAWVEATDYWGVYKEFEKHDLNISYPQMDVHVHKN